MAPLIGIHGHEVRMNWRRAAAWSVAVPVGVASAAIVALASLVVGGLRAFTRARGDSDYWRRAAAEDDIRERGHQD